MMGCNRSDNGMSLLQALKKLSNGFRRLLNRFLRCSYKQLLRVILVLSFVLTLKTGAYRGLWGTFQLKPPLLNPKP